MPVFGLRNEEGLEEARDGNECQDHGCSVPGQKRTQEVGETISGYFEGDADGE